MHILPVKLRIVLFRLKRKTWMRKENRGKKECEVARRDGGSLARATGAHVNPAALTRRGASNTH
eukprot:2613039-Pyramimonas_sp.AAC.1